MRKADYSLLSVILAREIAEGKRQQGVCNLKWDNIGAALAAQRQATAIAIAEMFAHAGHVDQSQFLKACGIEPAS